MMTGAKNTKTLKYPTSVTVTMNTYIRMNLLAYISLANMTHTDTVTDLQTQTPTTVIHVYEYIKTMLTQETFG